MMKLILLPYKPSHESNLLLQLRQIQAEHHAQRHTGSALQKVEWNGSDSGAPAIDQAFKQQIAAHHDAFGYCKHAQISYVLSGKGKPGGQ